MKKSSEEYVRCLIINGWKAYPNEKEWHSDEDRIAEYFRSITSQNLADALFRCEQGEQQDLEYSGKLLFAYFNWCDRYEIDSLPDGNKVDKFRLELLRLLTKQVCQTQTDNDLPYSFDLPKWQMPKLFENLPIRMGAKPKDLTDRNFSLYVLYLSAQKAQGKKSKTAVFAFLKQKIDIKGIGSKVIYRAVTDTEENPEFDLVHIAAESILKGETLTTLVNYFREHGSLTPLRRDK
jgi:hypothetical protein|tara:strand:- start:585 stop:1289 length:705 start_codon:yes stop_codon:yes gene_type:complete